MFKTMKLVYKNMVVDRPKVGLYGLLFMAGFCTANVYFSANRLDHVAAIFLGLLSLVMWLVVLPMTFTLIDTYKNPQRLEKIWNEKK
jgi:hypothetical protein